MRPTIRIAESEDFCPAVLQRLRQIADVDLRPATDIAEVLDECEVFWFRLGHQIRCEDITASARCRIIACPVTGLDHIDVDACQTAGMRVVSLRGETEFLREVRATAELTVGLALSLMRHISAAHASVLDGHWDRDLFRGRELYRKTAGIVGVGRLGSIVGEYLTALGMRVLGYDPHAMISAPISRVDSLDELLAESDLITLHASYGPATHHLLSADALANVKPGAVLINTARGGLLDDSALVDALESGHLSGAALDVIEGEPNIGSSHKLVRYANTHSNLLLVPHIGGNTSESFAKTEAFIAERVAEALREASLIP